MNAEWKRLLGQDEAAELLCTERTDTRVEWHDGAVSAREQRLAGAALRLLKDGCLGHGYRSGPADVPSLLAMARTTLASAPARFPSFPEASTWSDPPIYSDDLVGLSLTDMVQNARTAAELLRADLPAGARLSVQMDRAILVSFLQNTSGMSGEYTKTLAAFAMEVIWEGGSGDLLSCTAGTVSGRWADPAPFLAQVRQQVAWSRRRCDLPGGQLPVFLSPQAAAPFWQWLVQHRLHGGEGAGGWDATVLAPCITVLDDGTLPWGVGTVPFDDEGIPCRRRILVDRGKLVGRLFDLAGAARKGSPPTGNGFRDFDTAPEPAPVNLVVSAGTGEPVTWSAGVGRAVLVEQWRGVEHALLPNGDFCLPLDLAFLLCDGEVEGYVKGVMSGNITEALRRVVTVGSDVIFAGGRIYTPAIWLESLSYTSV